MNTFDKDEGVKPDESNNINLQPFIEVIKLQISHHIDNEIIRFEKTVHEIITNIDNIPVKGKYE